MKTLAKIAYFSMEIAIEENIPTYSGGLGVLAGDTLLAALNLKVPMVAITLLYRKGYCYQKLDPNGWQFEESVEWVIEDFLQELPGRIKVELEKVIVPMFYKEREKFVSVMQHCIALNGSFFNSQRMLQQYVLNAYFR